RISCSIGVPAIRLHVQVSEHFDGLVEKFAARRSGNGVFADVRDVEPFPDTSASSGRIDIGERGVYWEDRRIAPHPISSLLVAVGAVIVKRALVRDTGSQLRIRTGNVHGPID